MMYLTLINVIHHPEIEVSIQVFKYVIIRNSDINIKFILHCITTEFQVQ